jgi:hypothetical protein
MKHAAKDLQYTVDLLRGDASTVAASGIGAGLTDLTGRQLEQAQLVAAETSHLVVLRYTDGKDIPPRGYVRVTDPGTGAVTLYIVDYILDPRDPRPRVWIEVYCHAERAGN